MSEMKIGTAQSKKGEIAYGRITVGYTMGRFPIDNRIAAVIPPPRKHRNRYVGVLAPNSSWRALVTAKAGPKLEAERGCVVQALAGC